MPIYEYACQHCGARFEKLVRGEERPACPHCQGTELEKQLSAFAVGASQSRDSEPAGLCGSCGLTPGSCGLN